MRFILKTLFIFLLLLFSLPFILEINFSSFLKYSSYAECMKEEIKDNAGFHNSYIEDFCTNKFPKKFDAYVSTSSFENAIFTPPSIICSLVSGL